MQACYKSLYISDELANKVTNLAIENDTSFNNIVIKILESYFEQLENNKD